MCGGTLPPFKQGDVLILWHTSALPVLGCHSWHQAFHPISYTDQSSFPGGTSALVECWPPLLCSGCSVWTSALSFGLVMASLFRDEGCVGIPLHHSLVMG